MNRSPTSTNRHTLDGTIRIFLAEALMLPTGMLTVAFLTRQVGPEGYGLFALAATVVVWIEWSINSIFSRTTVKFVGEAENWQSVATVVMRVQLIISMVATILLILLSPVIATLLHEPTLTSYLQLFALEIPLFSLAQAHQNILVGLGSFQQRAISGAGRWIARLLLIVLFVKLGFSVPGAILGSMMAIIIDLSISRFSIRPSLFCRAEFPLRNLWGYAIPLFLSGLSLRLYEKIDLFAFKLLGGTAEQAGFYAAAQNLSLLPGVFSIAFAPLIISTLSRVLSTGDTKKAAEISRQAIRAVICLVPVAGLMAGAAPELVVWLFGSSFAPAAPLFAILIFGATALVMISVNSAIMIASGKPRWTFMLSVPILMLAIAGHYLLIPSLGMIGAAVVTTLVASLGASAGVLAVYHLWQVLPPLFTLVRSVFVCGLAYILAAVWSTPGILLLFKLPAIVLVIIGAFLLLGEFGQQEITLVRSLVFWQPLSENPRKF